MSLAVATTKTGALFSDNQVRKVPKTRAAVPPSVPPELWEPAKALSISSTHKIAGATDSATVMARRTFSSDDPTRLPNMRPMSKRRRGICHRLETALAQRLFPQPCTPRSRMLLSEDLAHILGAQTLILDDDLGENVLRLAEGETEGGLQQPFAAGFIEVNGHLLELLHVLEDLVQQTRKLFARGEGKGQHGDFFFQLRREVEQW